MRRADVNALIEGCRWPDGSPALRCTGGRGSPQERETAAIEALEHVSGRPYTTDDRARRVLNRMPIGALDMSEEAVFDVIDLHLRHLAFGRHAADPTRSVAGHLLDLADKIAATCDLWAALPDKLERYSPTLDISGARP